MTSSLITDSQSRRAYVRQVVSCRAILRLDEHLSLAVIIKDFCAGGLLLQQEDELQPSIDQLFQQGKILELVLQEPGMLATPISIKCVRAEKNLMGVQFVRDSQMHINALNQFDVQRLAKESTTIPRQNTLKAATTVVIFDRLTNRVVSCLDLVLTQFFKSMIEIKQDADVMINIRGVVAVNEVLDFLKIHAQTFTSECIDENRQYFKTYQANLTVKKPEVALAKQNSNIAKLSLVEKDDFEEWLSAKLVASKAEAEIKDEWQLLLIRLGYLVERAIDASTIPFSPAILCDRLRDQILRSSVRPPRNLVNKIYTLFYRCVLSQILGLVQQLNRDLSSSGCLPGDEVYKHLPARNLDSIKKIPAKNAPVRNKSNQEPIQQTIVSTALNNKKTNHSQIKNALAIPLLTEKNYVSIEKKSFHLENLIDVNIPRPEQQLTIYPLSESLNHARFLSSKAFQAVNHLLSIQQALVMPADIRKSQQADAEYGVSSVDLLDMIKQLQFEVLGNPRCLDAGLRASLEVHLTDSHRLTTQQLLSLSVAEKLFLTLSENVEFDKNLLNLLMPLALLLFKALLLDDALLRDEQHPVRQAVNAIAFLGCRAGSNVRAVHDLLQQTVKTLLRDFDRDNQIFSKMLPALEAQMSHLLGMYLRNLQKIQARFDGTYKIERARKLTLMSIDELLQGKKIAPLLLAILEADFCEALFLAYVKQGADSKFWKIGLLAIEELAVITSTHNANWGLLKLQPDKLFKLVQAAFNNFPDKKTEKLQLLQALKQVMTTHEVVAESKLVKYQPMLSDAEKLDPKLLLKGKWAERIRGMKVGDALRLKVHDKAEIMAHCAWIAPDRSRYVFVDHLGVIIADYSAAQVLEKFTKRHWRLSGIDDLSVFDQGLDVLIEKIYTELTSNALRDELTGLLNRKGFEKELDACLRTIQDSSAEHVMVYFTLHQFDILNTSGGYDAGDHFLQVFTKQLLESFDEHIVMARLGGTDFGLLLKHYDEQGAQHLVENLLDTIQAIKFEWKTKVYQFTVSFGVLPLHAGYLDVRKVLHDSQSAAFIAKDRGGRRIHVVVNHKNDATNLDHISSWVTKIDEVIATNSLRLRIHRIQSIKNANSGEVEKPHYEVLLSVLDGDQVLQPFEFISAAERYQRMGQVDCWVIKRLFEWLIANQDKQAEIGMLSVNLSGHSLNDGQLMKYIFEAFASSKIACEKICFEITETVALTDLDDIVDFMVELKNLGCSFALDDFGTGSASYQYLKRLPVNFIKIDGSFVRDMTRNRQDWAMVKSITDMGHLMGISVIAEYVEDAETLEQLKIIGVDYAQGYYIEKPKWL